MTRRPAPGSTVRSTSQLAASRSRPLLAARSWQRRWAACRCHRQRPHAVRRHRRSGPHHRWVRPRCFFPVLRPADRRHRGRTVLRPLRPPPRARGRAGPRPGRWRELRRRRRVLPRRPRCGRRHRAERPRDPRHALRAARPRQPVGHRQRGEHLLASRRHRDSAGGQGVPVGALAVGWLAPSPPAPSQPVPCDRPAGRHRRRLRQQLHRKRNGRCRGRGAAPSLAVLVADHTTESIADLGSTWWRRTTPPGAPGPATWPLPTPAVVALPETPSRSPPCDPLMLAAGPVPSTGSGAWSCGRPGGRGSQPRHPGRTHLHRPPGHRPLGPRRAG